MIHSMTGFGKATGVFQDKNISLELKSLNSKQADIQVKGPSIYKEKELEVRNFLTKELVRGKIECSIYVEGGGDKKTSINKTLAAQYFKELSELQNDLGISDQGDLLATILRMPEVLSSERSSLEEEEWGTVYGMLRQAVLQLREFRIIEGIELQKDLTNRLNNIESMAEKIPAFEEERKVRLRERIQSSIKEYFEGKMPDADRFEQEMIYYLEKLDISEEKVRLATHISHFRDVLAQEESQGKKLGFITQELGREINTIGSKANHAEIQQLVVQMKDDLEKIKEQILNVL